MKEAFGPAAADGGSGRSHVPVLPRRSGGIGPAGRLAGRGRVQQIDRNGAGRADRGFGMFRQRQRNLQEAAGPDEIVGEVRPQQVAPGGGVPRWGSSVSSISATTALVGGRVSSTLPSGTRHKVSPSRRSRSN